MVQIGKGDLSPALFETIDRDLEAHELVKVTMQKTSSISVREAAIECASETGSDIVQIIGRTFTLYRENREKKTGILK